MSARRVARASAHGHERKAIKRILRVGHNVTEIEMQTGFNAGGQRVQSAGRVTCWSLKGGRGSRVVSATLVPFPTTFALALPHRCHNSLPLPSTLRFCFPPRLLSPPGSSDTLCSQSTAIALPQDTQHARNRTSALCSRLCFPTRPPCPAFLGDTHNTANAGC